MMTKREENEFLKRLEEAKENKIFVQDELKLSSCIRGVYGFLQ